MTKIIFVGKEQKHSPRIEKLRKDLEDIFIIIENAHYSYEIWWILISREGRKKYFNKMVHFKEFFEPTASAHIASIVINLYKLFETRKDTLNFMRLIKEAERLRIFNSQQINTELQEAKALWKKINILRNKLFAHKNYLLTKEAIYREAQITPNKIKHLIELNLIIFNALWVSIGGKARKIDELSTRDTCKLFKNLSY